MLTRRRPLASRVKPAVPAAVKQRLSARAADQCEMRLDGCQGRGVDPSHRIGRGVGGGNGMANLLWACRRCHAYCHANPDWAKRRGLMLESWQDSTVEPVAYQNAGLVVLGDDGGLWPVGE